MSEEKTDIEKISEIANIVRQENIVFDNAGKMHVDNRDYRRERKRLWRSVTEMKKSVRHFTKKRSKSKSGRKTERQNRKNGRH